MRRLFLAIVLIAFGVNEINAQRRTNNNNNNRERVRTTQPVRTPRVRISYNTRRINPLRNGRFVNGYYNFNRFNNYYALGHRFVRVNPYGLTYSPEAQKQRFEELRAYMLYKYTLKPNKRNTRRLIKYNVLSGRNANEDINQ